MYMDRCGDFRFYIPSAERRTGGDDCKLKLWDSRSGYSAPAMANSKSFSAGVTTIQSHPLREALFAIGRSAVTLWH